MWPGSASTASAGEAAAARSTSRFRPMFNVGTGELMVILLIALLVLGPDKLPDAARKIGNVMAEVRRMSTGFQAEMRSAMEEATRTPLEPVKDPPETPVATAEAEPPAPPA